MKTVISLPTELFHEIDAKAHASKMTRSGLLTAAAREYLARRRNTEAATAPWNDAIAKGGQPGDDPATQGLRRQSKNVIHTTARSDR